MKVLDVLNFLNEKYPFKDKCDFDNVGLLVGSASDTVSGILVCLDCTAKAISKAESNGANLIITHHPIIFEPLKNVCESSLVFTLIKKGISVISAHTNLDVAAGGVNDCLTAALGFENIEDYTCSDGYKIKIASINPTSPDDLAKQVKSKLGYPIRYSKGGSVIKRVAVCSGSGGSFWEDVIFSKADAYITADIKHNLFYDAENLGITLIDAGHFATENIVVEPLAENLRKAFSKINIVTDHYTPINYL